MNFRIIVLIIFSYTFYNPVIAQENSKQSINFHPTYNNSIINFNQPSFYKIGVNDSIRFDLLKFYISEIELLNDGQIVWREENSFHLLDANENLLSILLNPTNNISYNQIKFNVGIDSTTNVSGALGGELDPTKGMYWTWQNGYINFKLEGKSNVCTTRNNEFQFHLGGYQIPFNTLQKIILPVAQNKMIDLNIDLEKLIALNDFIDSNNIVAPSKEAVILSKNIASIFSILRK